MKKLISAFLLGVAVSLLLVSGSTLFKALGEYGKEENVELKLKEPCEHLTYGDKVLVVSGFYKGATGTSDALSREGVDENGALTMVKVVDLKIKGDEYDYMWVKCSKVEVVK